MAAEFSGGLDLWLPRSVRRSGVLGSGLRPALSPLRAPGRSSRAATSAAIRVAKMSQSLIKIIPHACWYSDRGSGMRLYAADLRAPFSGHTNRQSASILTAACRMCLPHDLRQREPVISWISPNGFWRHFGPAACSGRTGPRPAVFSALPAEQNSTGLSNCIPP